MTNILITMGPSISDKEKLVKLYAEGIRILRFNFPHYNQNSAFKDIQVIREAEKTIGQRFDLLLDTAGPQIRTGVLSNPISYTSGEKFRIVFKESKRGDRDLFCDYPQLVQDAKIGQIIKIDSGLFDVKVIEKGSESLVVQAMNAFTVGSKRHVNLPGIHCNLPTITSEDYDDILFAIKNKFAYIAVSFTRSAKDILDLRNFLKKNNGNQMQIVAKIENQEGIDNLVDIVDASDMIMVARGDLGTELPLETIPIHQLHIIKICKEKKKPVIVATQMLESMITNPTPTRAEVSDIFYAVREGADYLMLSGETAVGKYPIESVEIMKKVIVQAQKTKNFT